MPEFQDPKQAPHLRHADELVKLDAHIAHFRSVGDETEAKVYEARKRHTTDRLEFAKMAAALCDQLGLSHEVNGTAITYNDAANFVGKTLHELFHDVKSSGYARSHSAVRGRVTQRVTEHAALPEVVIDGVTHLARPAWVETTDVHHCDEAKFTAPRDAGAEVVAHLGITDPAKITLVQKLFETVSLQLAAMRNGNSLDGGRGANPRPDNSATY